MYNVINRLHYPNQHIGVYMKDDWENVSVPAKPLCIHCKHVTYPDAPPTMQDLTIWARCAAVPEVNLIDGSIKLELCGSMRLSMGKCKPEGKLFQPSMGVVHG